MTKRMAVMLVVLTLVFGGIFGYKWIERKLTAEYLASYRSPPVAISAAVTYEDNWDRYLRATGSIVAIQEISVSSEADGIITAVHFESGDKVNKGDLLITLDDQVEKANLKSYQARLNLSQLNFDRDRKLVDKKLISRDRFDRSKAELDEVLALVEQTRAIIAQKQVRAPFVGKLGIRQVSEGQYMAAGNSAATLQSLAPLYVDFSFPEQHLPDVTIGQKLTFTIKAYPDKIFDAAVTAIDARVSLNTRNISVRAITPNSDELLLPGMFADVKLNLGQGDVLVVVPETAITYSLYGQGIFEIMASQSSGTGKEWLVKRRPVTTGAEKNGLVQISGNLVSGRMVVINGQNKLQNGTRVKVVNHAEIKSQKTSLTDVNDTEGNELEQ